MPQFSLVPGLLGLFGCALLGSAFADTASSAAPAAYGIGFAVVDFEYVDTSGEVIDQTAAHQERLQAFMSALRRDYEADGRYRLMPVSCKSSCMDDGPDSVDLLSAAKEGGAKLVMIGGIHKMSTLVQWARVEVIDVDTQRIVADRLFSFRGDSDEAWTRAESFVSREMAGLLNALPRNVLERDELQR